MVSNEYASESEPTDKVNFKMTIDHNRYYYDCRYFPWTDLNRY